MHSSIEDKNGDVRKFCLNQNYPNPFNPSTKINYELPTTLLVKLSIFNSLGQEVATLVSEIKKAGIHQVEWNAGNLSSGIYYYMLRAGQFQEIKRMVLLK